MIIFFPTYARRIAGGRRWRATIAGMVTRPLPARCRRRTLAVAVLKRLLDLDDAELETDVFRRRAEAFLFQRVAGQRVHVTIGDRSIDAGQSDRIGHFQVALDLDEPQVERLATTGPTGGRQISYTAAAEADEPGERTPEVAGGCIHLVDETGLSVISDIDDTVKVTNVANRRELLRNTLLRDFTAVPGMADVYRRWQAAGTAFHYVSASPWQLATCLHGFLGEAGLPLGSLHLKIFRLKDSTPLGRFPSRKRSKRRAIEQILDDFPGRRFVLVGDSGERDPEVYQAVARRRPAQVSGIAIRLLDGHAPAHKLRARLDRLARRLPAGSLRAFTAADELGDFFR
jgi:phosphatidate phosphatase APP1